MFQSWTKVTKIHSKYTTNIFIIDVFFVRSLEFIKHETIDILLISVMEFVLLVIKIRR